MTPQLAQNFPSNHTNLAMRKSQKVLKFPGGFWDMSFLLVFIISTGHKKTDDAWSKKLKRSTNYWNPVDLYSSETFKTTMKKDWHGSLYYRPKQCTIKDKSFKLPCFCINFDVPQEWVPLDDPKSFKFTKNLSYPFFIRFNLVRCFRDNVASHPEREMPSRKRTTSAFGVQKIRSHNLKKTQKTYGVSSNLQLSQLLGK